MHCTEKYSQLNSIIWPVWLNGWVFVYELSSCGFEYRRSHLNFRYRAYFEQGVPWYLGNCRVWIHSETRTWHDKNVHSNAPYRQLLTTHPNHLVSLAKWLNVGLWSKWLWVGIPLQSLYRACFEQGVPWHSGNYREWIHSEMHTWQSIFKFVLEITCLGGQFRINCPSVILKILKNHEADLS